MNLYYCSVNWNNEMVHRCWYLISKGQDIIISLSHHLVLPKAPWCGNPDQKSRRSNFQLTVSPSLGVDRIKLTCSKLFRYIHYRYKESALLTLKLLRTWTARISISLVDEREDIGARLTFTPSFIIYMSFIRIFEKLWIELSVLPENQHHSASPI